MSGTTCVECWAQWQSVSVTVLLLLMVVVGTGVVVSRGGTKRSVAMGIVRILVNYMQTVPNLCGGTCVGVLVAHMWCGGTELHHWRIPCPGSSTAHESHGVCFCW